MLSRKSDNIFLEHFGFGYINDQNLSERVVAVFLYDLHRLSPEHQQIWNAKLLGKGYKSKYKMHPDYLKSSLGSWDINNSIFHAIFEEVKIINEMTQKIYKEILFKNNFQDKKPERFGLILLPTIREMNDFYLTCCQVITDNLNQVFFKKNLKPDDFIELIKISNEKQKIDEFNKILNKSITTLDVFLSKNVKFTDPSPKDKMIKFFRDMNELRSIGAHSFISDKWDIKLFINQRKFVLELYKSIRCLRLIFANHIKNKDVKIPEWLQKGQISTI